MVTNDDELTLLTTDTEFKLIFDKVMDEFKLEKNEYKYEVDITRSVPLLRSFIFVSKRVYDEARAEERTRIIRALGNELTKTYAEQRYIDGIRDVIAFIKEMK